VDFQASNTTGFATQSINSLRFNTAAANTLTNAGTLTISSGGILETANVGNNATTITGGTLAGSAQDLVVIQNNTSNSLTINSSISGAGLTKSGAGELILAPTTADTFTGVMYLNGGLLNTTSNGIGSAGSFTFNGGTLQAANAITSSKSVAIGATGGTIDTNGNTVTLSGNVTSIGGQIGGAGNLGGFNSTGAFAFTKSGTGTLALSGSGNAFGGPLIINSGTVQDANAAAATLGTGYINFGASNSPTVDLDGHSPTVAGLIGAGTNGLVTSSAGGTSTLTLDGVASQTFAGVVQNGSGTVGLTVALNNPTEAQTLSGANTYTGPTTINAGILTAGVASVAGTSGAFGNNSAVTMSATTNAATLNLNGFNTQVGSLAGGSATGGNVTLGSGTLTLGGVGISTSYAGVISGTGGLAMNATGVQALTGTNTYTGPTTIGAGTLQLAAAGTAGSANGGTLANSTTGISVNAGTLLVSASNAIGSATPVALNGGSFTVAASVSQGTAATVSGGGSPVGNNVQGLGALTLTSASTLTFSGASSTLVFGAFNDPTNVTLSVTGYVNTTFDGVLNSGQGADDRLVFDQAGGLTQQQLADINFGAGEITEELSLGGNFYEVSPVPEPAAYWGGLLVVASGICQYRRQRRGCRVQ
jgi:autotransporter-associated beta strand protein